MYCFENDIVYFKYATMFWTCCKFYRILNVERRLERTIKNYNMNILKLTTILFFAFNASLLFGQSELIIEINTDINPDETSWVLSDVNNNVILSRTDFDKSANHNDTIVLDNSTCYIWTIYDTYGDGLSAGDGGSFALHLDGTLLTESQDPNFGDSASVYSIGQVCSANDINVLGVDMLYYISKDLLEIKFQCINQATEPIESVEFTYSVNGTESASKTVDGLNIPVGDIASIAHTDLFDFNTPGDYTIAVNVTKVNGVDDSFVDNNTAIADVEVVDGFIRMNIMEDFASYDCGPCWDADIKINNSLSPYPGTYTFVKYLSWDFADTKYFPEIEPLLDYYNAGGLPHVRLNGNFVSWTTFAPSIYEEELGYATPVKITVEGSVVGDSIYTRVVLFSNETFDKELTLRGIIQEEECVNVSIRNPDNSYPFHNVAYTLTEKSQGIVLDGLVAGEEYVFEQVTSLYKLHLEDDSLEDFIALYYLQDKTERKIYQSAWSHLSFESIDVETSFNIADNAVDVDTAGLFVEYSANRLLYDIDGRIINDLSEYVTLKQDSFDGADVPYNAELLVEKNGIKITNQYKWRSLNSYHVEIAPMFTLEGKIIPKSMLSFSIKDYNGTVVDENSFSNSIEIYPNPTTGVLNIQCSEVYEMQIYDISGQALMTKNVANSMEVISIETLKAGVYFIQLVNINGESETYKILKK